MSWGRIDDDLHSHPKIVGLANRHDPLNVWVRLNSWCRKHSPTGVVPQRVADLNATRKCIARLVASGLWEVVENGFRFHDFEHYGPKEERDPVWIEKNRAGGLARAATAIRIAGRFAPATAGDAGASVASAADQPNQPPDPDPDPDPEEKQPLGTLDDEVEAVFARCPALAAHSPAKLAQTMRMLAMTTGAKNGALVEIATFACAEFVIASDEAKSNPVRYVAKIARRLMAPGVLAAEREKFKVRGGTETPDDAAARAARDRASVERSFAEVQEYEARKGNQR